MHFLVGVVQPVGPLVAGLLGSLVGSRLTLLVAVLGLLAGSLPVLFSPLRNLRDFPVLAEEAEEKVNT
jgi:MFS family permease